MNRLSTRTSRANDTEGIFCHQNNFVSRFCFDGRTEELADGRAGGRQGWRTEGLADGLFNAFHLVILDGDVEDEAADAGNGHGDDDRGPTVEEDVIDERVMIGEVEAEWRDDEQEDARNHRRLQP